MVIEKYLNSENLPPEIDPYPKPTHKLGGTNPKWDNDIDKTPIVTVRQVINDLPEPDQCSLDLSQNVYSKARRYGKHCQGQIEINLLRALWLHPYLFVLRQNCEKMDQGYSSNKHRETAVLTLNFSTSKQ